MLLLEFISVYCRVNILEMSVLIPVSGVYLDKQVGREGVVDDHLHLISPFPLPDRYYQPHFRFKKEGSQRLSNLPKVTAPVDSGEIQTRLASLQRPSSFCEFTSTESTSHAIRNDCIHLYFSCTI